MASLSLSPKAKAQRSYSPVLWNSGLLAVVFFIAFVGLTIGVSETGIASGYVDPVSRIAAQDEAVYSHSAIQMAKYGSWMTPVFLDRLALYKPPLLYWASGSAAKLLGITPLALRLPSLLAGALLVTLVFWWVGQSWGLLAACGSAMLLASSHLFFVLARLNLTDALLTLFFAGAALCLYRDPDLQSRRAFFGFALCSAAAILTKGVAGVMPLLMAGIYWVPISRRANLFLRFAKLAFLTAMLAAPWFIYQLLTHPRWFWAEFVLVENIAFGTGSPPQTSNELPALFYIRRMFLLDPVLTALVLGAIPFWWKRLRGESALLLSWVVAIAVALLSYQYRNASYLLPAVVAFSIAAAPLTRYRVITFGVLPAVLLMKLYSGGEPWGLPSHTGTTVASAVPLQRYCEKNRGNVLIVVSPDDEFYSTVLPLPRVRYCYLSPNPPERKYALDFAHLGIVLTADQFIHSDELRPVFAGRLAEWRVPTDRAIGTVILARTPGEIAGLIASHPDDDFFVPKAMFEASATATHDLVPASASRVFLLSRTAVNPPHQPWGCRL